MKEMSQLYSRVFLQILDSSIAEDFTVRHVFEDLLKLADHKTGIVDMTRSALARRINCPLDVLNGAIDKLESPDPASRDPEFEGRRIQRLDTHRDWAWKILNWEKYESVRTKADVYLRVSKHRDKVKTENPPKGFIKPTLPEVKLFISELSLPTSDADWFFYKCEANGWTNGGRQIRDWQHTVRSWKAAGYMASQHNPNGVQKEVKKRDPNIYIFDSLRFTKDNPPKRDQFANESAFLSCQAGYEAHFRKVRA